MRCPSALTARYACALIGTVVRVVHRTQANAFPNAFALVSGVNNKRINFRSYGEYAGREGRREYSAHLSQT